MAMSRKHYEADAAALARILWSDNTDPATMSAVIAALANVRSNDNEQFDRSRWLDACTKNPFTE